MLNKILSCFVHVKYLLVFVAAIVSIILFVLDDRNRRGACLRRYGPRVCGSVVLDAGLVCPLLAPRVLGNVVGRVPRVLGWRPSVLWGIPNIFWGLPCIFRGRPSVLWWRPSALRRSPGVLWGRPRVLWWCP